MRKYEYDWYSNNIFLKYVINKMLKREDDRNE